MLPCFTSKSVQLASLPTSEDRPANSQDKSAEETPTSSATSATVNLSREFSKAVHTSSYNEVRSKIHFVEECENGDINHQQQRFFAEVLKPNDAAIREALQNADTNSFTQQIFTYFAHTEQVCHLLLTLNEKIRHARVHYIPIQELVNVLPNDSDSLTHEQCDWVYDIFLQFEGVVNPFSCPEYKHFNEMQSCFSDLKAHVDGSIDKFQSRVRMVRCATTGTAVCFIGTVVGLAATAISIAAHALVALVAGPILHPGLKKVMKKDLAHIALLDAALRSAYVLHNDLQTVDRLARHLETAVDGDKSLARIGTVRGRERHPVNEVAKRLVKNHGNVQIQLTDLEEHICICFVAINRARSLLLQEIQLHHSS